MKKILTIAATGVICVLAGATQTFAQQTGSVGNTGNAGTLCAITSTAPGTLALNADGDKLSTDVTGGTKGAVSVRCAQAASLKLGVPAVTSPPSANATTPSVNFGGGATAGFIGIGAGGPSGDTIAPVKTNRTGATATVSTTLTVTNPSDFITPGAYSVSVPATLTP